MRDLPVTDCALFVAADRIPQVARGEGGGEHLVVIGRAAVGEVDQLPRSVEVCDRLLPALECCIRVVLFSHLGLTSSR